jgi:hypothetical protein
MFDTIKGFGDQLFAVIVLVVCAGISSHFCFGYGSKKAKEVFIALILVLIVGTQFYHLIQAATYVPASKFFVFDVSCQVLITVLVATDDYYHYFHILPQDSLHRSDCLLSNKGASILVISIGMINAANRSCNLTMCLCKAGSAQLVLRSCTTSTRAFVYRE